MYTLSANRVDTLHRQVGFIHTCNHSLTNAFIKCYLTVLIYLYLI